MTSKKVVIIPTYNEKENIQKIIREVLKLKDNFHILVVDDGSPDGTGNIVKRLQKEFPESLYILEREEKSGLGSAYIAGFNWSLERGYEFIIEMDADFSHNPEDLNRLYHACTEGADLAIGSRYCKGVNVLNWPMMRLLMSYYGSMYVRFVLRIPVMDTTAGFKCYKDTTLKAIDFSRIQHIGYGFQIEMKFNVHKLGFKIVEVPIVFVDRTLGTSKMSAGIFKEAIIGVIGLKWKSYFRKWKRVA